jgi:quercetin dioxygenase-like cupin family protein
MRQFTALIAALFGGALLLSGGAARAADADADAEMGRRIQELLRAHQADVFGCVASTKARAEGEMLVRVIVGENGRAARAEVLKDQSGGGPLGACLTGKIAAWDLSPLGAATGDQVVFPLAFRPEASTPVVHAPPPSSGSARIEPHVLVRGRASLTLIRLAATVRLALHTHPSGEAIYVVRGIVRLRQPGRPQVSLKAGEGAYIAAEVPHSLEAAPLAPAELLQIFDPAGPENDYALKEGRSTRPSSAREAAPAFVAADVKPRPIFGGKGEVKLLLDGSGAPLALDQLGAQAGAGVPAHAHKGSDEILYILGGRGTTTISGQSFTVAKDDAILIPAGAEHSLVVDEALSAVQVYAPGGPEQRFKK